MKERADLDHLRWVAAFLVVFQHARGFVMVDYTPGLSWGAWMLYFVTGFSHQAVVIFFVLSGYLVGGKVVRLIAQGSSARERRRYGADRAVRILVVLWPALLLTAVVALVAPRTAVLTSPLWAQGIGNVAADTHPIDWAGTALLINEIFTATVRYDGPLWSLAYEWSYYVIAGAALFLAARDYRSLGAVVIGYAGLLVLSAALLSPQLLLMMIYWLIGAAASRIDRWRAPFVSAGILAAALLAARVSLLGRFGWADGDDLLVALAASAVVADRSFRELRFAAALGARLAGFSYSLYAIHVPVQFLLVSVLQANGILTTRLGAGAQGYALVLVMVAVSYAAAWPFAALTELRTAGLRARLRRWTDAERVSAA